MADYVVDTNVLVMVDRPIAEVESIAELDCIQACQQWLNAFINRADTLVVDTAYKILGEYRRNIPQGGSAYRVLANLETAPRERIIETSIEFDEHGFAQVPFPISDANDRKFVAVALAHNPTPPIVDATDTDWEKDHELLAAAGITVHELCSEYILQRLGK